jgi:cell division protein FtsI (penicillin-binding protein 3)
MGDTRKDILFRVYIVFAFICLFGSAIIFKVWHIQNVEGDHWRAMADSITTDMIKIEPARGNIYATDLSPLATSVPVYDLRVDMLSDAITNEVFNSKVDSLSQALAGLFRDKPASEYKRMLREARREGERYYLLRRDVSHRDLQSVKKFPIFRMGRYKGGLIADQKNKRIKTNDMLAARTIGYIKEGVEPVGIEGAFDKYLKGRSGLRMMQRISGNVWKPLYSENEVEPEEGKDVVTTIDLNLQDVAHHSLETQLMKHNADKGCAILMEVQTGSVLAITNLKRGNDGVYREEFNFGMGESTEPGSTFKLASIMALLEDGYVDLDDTVDTQGGAIRYANRVMKDSHEGGYGKTSMQHVFEVSSNVGISKVVNKYYSKNPQAFIDRVRGFGLGMKLDLQIPGEGRPFLKNTDDKYWSKVSLPYISIGYECSFTPLQVLTFYNAVANNGTMMRPRFVKEIRYHGQVVQEFKPVVLKDSIASPATISKARQVLEGVVERGTATNLKHAQYKIAGKTGTAQIANANEGYKVGKVRHQASFVGYFPADNPRYSCIVVVYAPNNNVYYAASVAGPIFKEIADKVYASNPELHKELKLEQDVEHNLPIVKAGHFKQTEKVLTALSIPAKLPASRDNWIASKSNSETLDFAGMKFRHDQVPNVLGMGLRDAIYILESRGLQVRIVGRGQVTRQSINAGSKVEKGQEIVIQLG